MKKLWENYNSSANELSTALGRTNNIVGEYAEYLTAQYYQGTLLSASHKSADVKVVKGNIETLYQVKSRKIKRLSSSQLGIIRSWDFDYLIVIIFDLDGVVLKALEVPVNIAKEYATQNDHQHGWVISTTKDFLNNKNSKDISNVI